MQDILEAPQMSVVKFSITDSEIAKMKEEYMGLTVAGIEDKAGLRRVYESRQIVKKTRTSLVKAANEMKETAIAWQRKVNSEKDRIVGELEVIEAHLQAEEDKIEVEKARIQKEKDDAEAARIQARIDKLAEYGFQIDYVTITAISDADFERVLTNAKAEHEKEQVAIKERERLAAEEATRLKAEREELERLRAEQAEAQRIINENNARIAREQAADVLYDLIQGKVVKEREYNVNSFRDIISRLKRIHKIPLRHVDVEAKTRHGEVRKYRKHFLLSIHRKKAIRVYEKVNR